MKRIFTFALLLSSFAGSAFAQGQMDALNYSYYDLRGTARSVAMGGAFGALGGDVGGIAINPAGIGIYTTPELVTTLNFSNTRTETNLTGIKTNDSRFKFSFDNLAFVGVVPLDSDVAPTFNFGFSYNRLNSFDRRVTAKGYNLQWSQTDYVVDRIKGISSSDLSLKESPFFDRPSDYWIGASFYNTGLVEPTGSGNTYRSVLDNGDIFKNGTVDNYQHVFERGSVDSYDFNMGTTFADMVSWGMTVSMTDLNYRIYSLYGEDFFEGNANNETMTYDYENWLRTDGTGWQVKTGVIVKPVQQLRLGVAYHSPTWYNMTDFYSVRTESFNRQSNRRLVVDSFDEEGNTFSDYNFRTPDKWVFSLAGVIPGKGIVSADLDLTNYARMGFHDTNGRPFGTNQDIREDFRNSLTLHLGGEYMFNRQVSARVGYMWQQSPIKDILVDGSASGNRPAATAGTITHFSLPGDAHYFTYGFGYRFSPQFYTNVAFVMKTRTDDWYSFGGSDQTKLKTNMFNGLLTLGYRFTNR